MAYSPNPSLAAAMLGAAKTALDGGFLYIFSGPMPASADDALDMGNDHTQLAMISLDNDGVTGLDFDAVSGNLLVKVPADVWRGTVAFDGADDGESSLGATFARFCQSGDNGRGAGTTPRLQCDAGGPSSLATLRTGVDELADNGTNTVTISVYTLAVAG